MDTIKTKLVEWSKDKSLIRVAATTLGVLLVLIICLCISIGMRTNIQTKYSSTATQLQQQAYQNMNNMTQLFARIDDPNVDVRYKLIPELKAQYVSAAAISTVLNDNCGRRYAALSQEQIAAFDAAFESFATAYREDAATGLAQADMAKCMEDVQEMVDEFFAPEEDEEDDVVIIDAASGKIENPKDEEE